MSPRTPQATAVVQVWTAYARMPRERRGFQALLDAWREGEALTGGDAEATYTGWRLQRRAYADLTVGGSITGGDLDDVWIPSTQWDECLRLARAALNSNERKGLDAMGFVQVACFKPRRSTVTGNLILDDEKRWPVKP